MPNDASLRFEVVRVEIFEGDEGVVTLKPLFCMNKAACEEIRLVTYVGRRRNWQEGQRLKLTDFE